LFLIFSKFAWKGTIWGFEEKGRKSARVESLTARDLPYGRTVKKRRLLINQMQEKI